MFVNRKFAPALTLVPNQRAHDLHLAHEFRCADGAEVLAAPALDILSRWIEQTSARIDLLQGQPVAATAGRLRLDHVWRSAVNTRPEWISAFESHTLAQSARAAERLLRHWCPGTASPWLGPGFQGWREYVQVTLRSQGLYTAEDWLNHLRSQLEQPGSLPLRLPAAIELRGFVEITRLEQSLLQALRRRGVEINVAGCRYTPETPGQYEPVSACGPYANAAKHVLHAFDSNAEEWRAAADWAGACLRQGRLRIAVVVNGLDSLASQLAPVFDRVLHPRDGVHVAVGGDGSYHLADSCRLSTLAVVDDALHILRLSVRGTTARRAFPDISRLLLSPYLAGWRSERQGRAQFELALRGEGRFFWSLRELAGMLARDRPGQQLPVLSDLLRHAGPIALGADPGQAVLNRLLAWGWPGPVTPHTALAGRVQQFTRLIEQLREVDPASDQEAIDTLSRWCRDTTLTERGGPLSPVQLLSPEDAVGQRFDAAWVMNVHDGNWPGHATTNPLLSQDVLKYIPRATPAGELDYGRCLQGHLDGLATEVHFSWSRAGEEAPRLPSPLIACASAIETDSQPVLHWPVLSSATSGSLDYPNGYASHCWLRAIEDTRGLPLHGRPEARVPGGSEMVRDQSACPLVAYLSHRLQLRHEPMPGPFADYAFRGKLLHEALHQLYREQIGRPGLPGLEQTAAAVEAAMQRHRAHARLAPPALQAEQQRLISLLRQWLVFESQRTGFVVAALEEKRSVPVHGLVLDIRLDRVDRLVDGRHLIIDYKSGVVDTGGWVEERIGEPQLPLYAVLLDLEQPGSVGGLALASVRAGDCRLSGIVDEASAACHSLYHGDNRKSSFGRRFAGWEDLFSHWKTGIGTLLEEIESGFAANRLHDPKALKYKGLEVILRRTEGESWLLAQGIAQPEAKDD